MRRSRELAGSAGVGASPGGYSDGGARTERLAWPGARPRQPVGLLKGGIVRQWRRDGIPIDDEDLGDLASCDGEALCEFEGVRFRFTAESIAGHPVEPAPRHGNAVVLTLRQIGGPRIAGGIHLVEFTEAGPLASASCEERQCGQLADALEITDRTARRYLCAELFHKAQDIVAGGQAA